MKKLIVLPGNSPRNKAWGEACAAHFTAHFDEVHMQTYAHWESGKAKIDFAAEIAALEAVVDADDEDTEYVVYAKSAGTLLLLEAVAAGAIAPDVCVFFGMPLDMAAENLFAEDWSHLADFMVPTLAFHNDQDPVASYEFVKEKIAEYGENITFTGLVGDTHDYLDFGEYEETMRHFTSTLPV